MENFIICTRESHEDTYQAVQRNVRQFLDGMRNYLLTQHGMFWALERLGEGGGGMRYGVA